MGLLKFINNVRYLFRYNIKQYVESQRRLSANLERCVLPRLQYAEYLFMREPVGVLGKPKVMTVAETLEKLLTSKVSLVRYGEGELLAAKKQSIPFQKADDRLAKRLEEILQSDDDDVLLCIDGGMWYCPPAKIQQIGWDDWWFVNRPYFRVIADEYTRAGKVYGETTCTYTNNTEVYDRWRSLWEGKDLSVVCGDRVFSQIEYNIFDNAASVEYLYIPSENAFSEYDSIMERCKRVDKGKIVCIIAGPTATVLAYDLCKLGYRALDVGHLAKMYDVLKRELPREHERVKKFWEPD